MKKLLIALVLALLALLALDWLVYKIETLDEDNLVDENEEEEK